jgi:hypothetical protein
MPFHTRIDGDVAVLSNLGRMMNDPRYVDAGREVRGLLDRGYRHFVSELGGVRDVGPPLAGVLVTVTREVRRHGGEAVLARVSPDTARALESMRLDDYWDAFEGVEEAKAYFARRPGTG